MMISSKATNKECNGTNLYEPRKGMPIQEYALHVEKLGLEGLYYEFDDINQNQNLSTYSRIAFDSNPRRNRYPDVACFDSERVCLLTGFFDPPPPPFCFNDYVHANYVDGFGHERAFISTQGPLAVTQVDFWKMVYQEGTFVIVMLTKFEELGKEKCCQYWPGIVNKTHICDKLSIRNLEITSKNGYVVSKLQLKHLKTLNQRIVYHLWYNDWPDNGTPSDSNDFHELLDEMNTLQANTCSKTDQWTGCSHGPPIVVHCSAGIGRTGTFMTLDIQRKKLEATGLVDVVGCVKMIRTQRRNAVQRPEQFAFLNLAVLQYALKCKMISGIKLDEYFSQLSDIPPGYNIFADLDRNKNKHSNAMQNDTQNQDDDVQSLLLSFFWDSSPAPPALPPLPPQSPTLVDALTRPSAVDEEKEEPTQPDHRKELADRRASDSDRAEDKDDDDDEVDLNSDATLLGLQTEVLDLSHETLLKTLKVIPVKEKKIKRSGKKKSKSGKRLPKDKSSKIKKKSKKVAKSCSGNKRKPNKKTRNRKKTTKSTKKSKTKRKIEKPKTETKDKTQLREFCAEINKIAETIKDDHD